MHRRRPEPNQEGRLRAACDRCHDLKNRCVRIGGPDSRCERCERLDIDCVYQNSSRIGRPRRQRKTSTPQAAGQTSREAHQRVPSAASDRIQEESVIVTTGPGQDGIQAEADTILHDGAAPMDSPSDAMSFLMSPKGCITYPAVKP